jgi:FSR family fosmidomycin resistance protein-like MFS transporter
VDFLVERGRSHWYGGLALSTVFAAGVVGGLIGGDLSDRIGRRALLVGATVLTPPLLYLYLWVEDGSWWVFPLLFLAGSMTMAPRSVTLAVTSELVPEARGPMAGLLLALGFVTASLAALGFGAFASEVGILRAYWIVPLIYFTAVPFVALLPRRVVRVA